MTLRATAAAIAMTSLACGGGEPLPQEDTATCAACDDRATGDAPPAFAAEGNCLGGECAAPPSTCDTAVRYPIDATHSPLTCEVVSHLRSVAARAPGLSEASFMKVGDSISATHEFLHCFETEDFDLADTGHGALADTREHFLGTQIEGTSPFARTSEATRVGMTALWALEGTPPPVEREAETMSPRYAFVMFGTNDIQYGGPTAPADEKFERMSDNMLALLDWHTARGIVPVLYAIPPYNGESVEIQQLAPTYNALLRAMAEHRKLPFVNYHREMKQLPNDGVRDDGVHPSADYIRLCNFDEEGLQYGYNLRNLLTLQALDRVWSVTRSEDPAAPLDQEGAPPLEGSGAALDPVRIDALPFGDMRYPSRRGEDTSLSAACQSGQGDTKRVTYRLELEQATPLRLVAVGYGDARVRLSSVAGISTACPEKAALVETTFPAGTHEITLDVVRPEGGEAVLVVDRCRDDDGRCQ